jgi:hypothetical protein
MPYRLIDAPVYVKAHVCRIMRLSWVCAAPLLCASLAWLPPAEAEEPSSTWNGKQAVGVVVGGMLPVRLMDTQSSRLNGVAVHPS